MNAIGWGKAQDGVAGDLITDPFDQGPRPPRWLKTGTGPTNPVPRATSAVRRRLPMANPGCVMERDCARGTDRAAHGPRGFPARSAVARTPL